MVFLNSFRRNAFLFGLFILLSSVSTCFADEPRLTLRFASDVDRHDAVITAVTLSPDGALIAAGGDDHGVRVWDAQTGEVVHVLDGHEDWVRAACFSATSDSLATVGNDHTLRIWSLSPERSTEHDCLVRLAEGPLQSVAFHPNQKQLVTVGFEEPLRLFNLSSGEEMDRFGCACVDTRAVAVSPDGRWMAAAGRNGVIRVWDLTASGGSTDLSSDGRRVRALAFSPEGNMLAAAGDGPAVQLWRLEDELGGLSRGPEEMLIRPGKVHSLAFVSSRMLAVGGTNNTIQLWNTDALSRQQVLRGHTGTIAALAASEDGSLLASGSYDATVCVWDLAPEQGALTASIKAESTNR